MKNIPDFKLKKCIYLTFDEYAKLITFLFNESVVVEIEDFTDLIYLRVDRFGNLSFDDVKASLEKHFEINISSIHLDGCEYPGVWIVYSESNKAAPDAHNDSKRETSVLIDYIGCTVEAKEVNWYELDAMNSICFMRDSSANYLYLGNYYSAHAPEKVYALFSNPERTEKYCVELPPVE